MKDNSQPVYVPILNSREIFLFGDYYRYNSSTDAYYPFDAFKIELKAAFPQLYKKQITKQEIESFGFKSVFSQSSEETYIEDEANVMIKYNRENGLMKISTATFKDQRATHVLLFRGKCIDKLDFAYLLEKLGLFEEETIDGKTSN